MNQFTTVLPDSPKEADLKDAIGKLESNCILKKYAESRKASLIGQKASNTVKFCSDLYPRGVDTSDYVIFGQNGSEAPKKRKSESDSEETSKKTKVDTTSLMNKLCVICYCRLAASPGKDGENPVLMTNCSHIFHKKCLNQWITHQKICPCCRKDI